MSRKIKVLQLQNRYNVNASDLAEQVIQGLPVDRFEVTTAFLRDRPQPGGPESRAPRSVYFDFRQSDLKGLRLRALWRLYKLCREERFDVVIAHRFKPMNMLMLLNRWLRIPLCIGVQHGIGDFDRAYRRWEARRLLTSNWRVVGVSRAVRDYLVNCGAGFDTRNTVQINNAIDISRAESLQHPRGQARAMLGLTPEAFVFGTIGRLVPVKGHIYLIEAFARVQARYPQALVAIIGEGRARADLEAAIARHGLQGRVHLLGAKEDALQYVRAYDVFVMPSLSEGLPLALLEGMSGHLPVIGSDIDSLRPILEDCGGHLFRSGDVDDLAARLEQVLELSPQALREEGERAYAYLCEAHGIIDFRRQYLELISEGTPGSTDA
ncbi:glycosyltransferase [Zestomonas carbonaria]|uniref:D-inositol-3-phosphate glycosyltransferase n=1 Tax=Zestomonas carbonaria TaxID=2762745 RepID=A0A7U7I880_9GAMM|nr:glycosyltransferase [Pseudomonas carbonaria]CAD5107049.1 D-inositol-3-phosphate glycosyltransferase [Pseudomonas carbonaria]